MTAAQAPVLLLFESGATARIHATRYDAPPGSARPIDAFLVTDCGPDMQGAALRGASAAHAILAAQGRIDKAPTVIGFDLEGLPAGQTTVGASAGLAFALATAQLLLEQNFGPVAATGEVLNSLSGGPVGPVQGVPEKLKAAAKTLPRGSALLYPVDNETQIPENLVLTLKNGGYRLLPVANVERALSLILGAPDKVSTTNRPSPLFGWMAAAVLVVAGLGVGAWWLNQKPLAQQETIDATPDSIDFVTKSQVPETSEPPVVPVATAPAPARAEPVHFPNGEISVPAAAPYTGVKDAGFD